MYRHGIVVSLGFSGAKRLAQGQGVEDEAEDHEGSQGGVQSNRSVQRRDAVL